MTEPKRERRVRLGNIPLELSSEKRNFTTLEEFFRLARSEAEETLAAILKQSRSNPTRVSFQYQDEEYEYDYYRAAHLIVWGHRPETDREHAARLKRAKRAEKAR